MLGSNKAKHPQLEYESKVYKTLAGGVGVPFVQWLVTKCDYNTMVFDLLGPSLEDLFGFCNHKFSLKTVLFLAGQLPDNFLIGIGRHGNQLLTFPLEQAHHDDLESLAYVLMYFLRSQLPWQGLKAVTKKQKHGRIMEKKMATPTDLFHLRKLFRDLFVREGYPDDKCSNPNDKPRRKVIGDEEGGSQSLIPDMSDVVSSKTRREQEGYAKNPPSASIATALEEDLKSFTKLRRFNMFDKEVSSMNINFSSILHLRLALCCTRVGTPNPELVRIHVGAGTCRAEYSNICTSTFVLNVTN
ncbi:unnamed protein product [Rhizoctonia solani]|uniref:Casein kinase I n=1 Tax=Rhizoctonia solani TaxID=456999 RepID=A0A8H3HWJ4_9AGAM|nr:unnamed protein product [Rhizoctonia solani]